MSYHTVTTTVTVKPTEESIFSELSTEITLLDEGAGMFLKVTQAGKINPPGDNSVCINPDEWPYIKDAIELMLEVIKREESK